MTQTTWKSLLADQIPDDLANEIDVFETQMALRRQGQLDPKVFAETRLRRGVYGQRYDNGQRHDGVASRRIEYPSGTLEKGPDTMWDAPGMMRIKIPMGRVENVQLEVLAELAEEYSDAILHVTTRQDLQLHFVHIEDTPALMRRLAAVGITTREACGNSVRNVTACHLAGVCHEQGFDVTPYAHALTYYLLGHRDTQDFGRKFKISFSGCVDSACGLANIHDIGLIAVRREVDGASARGFAMYVGGGLGAVPHKARQFSEFVPEHELLPLCQAICRVFARLGERKNRTRARLKFLVAKLGIDAFRTLVEDERAIIPEDERWTRYLDDLSLTDERPVHPGQKLAGSIFAKGFAPWRASNVRAQAQPGYAVATVRLPLGDLSSEQARGLAALTRRYAGDTLRLTVEQNAVVRWLPEASLPAFYEGLRAIDLADPGAGTIADITACPGTDTCKLGISASRGLAGVLERDLASKKLSDEVSALRIKTSGCFNSCGQHHIADIGFLGVSRTISGRRVAHFQLVVGGQWARNGGSFGLAIGAFPAKRIPQVVAELTELWRRARQPHESLQAFIQRTGRADIRRALDHLRQVPDYDIDPSFYVDWGDAREYTIGDLGVGECAGEVVSQIQFGLSDSERAVFEAQLALDRGDIADAAHRAYRAMLGAARALIREQYLDVADEPDVVVSEFRARFHDTGLFHDPFAGAKFANFLFRNHREASARASRDEQPSKSSPVGPEQARRTIEEAQLFIEAAHACYERLQAAAVHTEETSRAGTTSQRQGVRPLVRL